MTTPPDPDVTPIDVAASAAQLQIKGQVRLALAALAGALVGNHILPAGLANDTILDAASALIMIGIASAWQWARVRLQHTRLWSLALSPRIPNDLVRPADPQIAARVAPIMNGRALPVAGIVFPAPSSRSPAILPVQPRSNTMSIGSTLKAVLGFVAGIFIPGANKDTTNLTHSIQQHLADLYGAAAAKMATELKLDTTGMSGPDKVFAITNALVATAQKDGFKGDLKILAHVAVDIAQSAFRSVEPNIGSDIVALATSLTANPLVLVASELVAGFAQKAADKIVFAPAHEVVQPIPAQ